MGAIRTCKDFKYVTKRLCNQYGCWGTKRVRVCARYK